MVPNPPILPKSTQDVDESKYTRHGATGGSTSSTIGAFLKGRRARTILYASILFLGSVWLITQFGHSNWRVKSNGDVYEHTIGDHGAKNDAAAVAAVEGDLMEVVDADLSLNNKQESANDDDEGVMPVEAEIRSLMQRYPVLVFSKSYCPFSMKAKKVLATYSYKIPMHVEEVDLRDDGMDVKQALTLMTGRSTFPNVFINGESIGGGDEVAAMEHSGQLVDLLTKAGVLQSSD
ncbi:hypothetical protein INT44_007313 [Umbelopsis vinacea]|uniref:Glutaredoxin domain-containing protein n=1 Tax=Umbelopsis vinacea TaxID=44442 RepID=A0A8H7UEQ1_9FUNG|nr:hypothetical protein INT44_007313 [Umbelopsis vinacea]KAI9286499.1 thioredoxin-like protein [Umbelopsis sp. AD052]